MKTYPIAPVSEWWAHCDYKAKGGIIVITTPDAFLRSVRPLVIDDASRDAIDELKALMLAGQTLTPAEVWLTDGKIMPRDHDGRHRAAAAKELGIARFHVLVFNADMTKAKINPFNCGPSLMFK